MATAKTKDSVKAHFEALFAADARVTLKILRNEEKPTPLKKEAEIDGRCSVYVRFSPSREEARSVGGATIPWDEVGSFQVYCLVGANSSPAALLAEEIAKTARDSLRAGTSDAVVDVMGIIEAEPGPITGRSGARRSASNI